MERQNLMGYFLEHACRGQSV